MRWLKRAKEISLPRIADSGSLVLGPEVVGSSVGFGLEKHVFVVSKPEAEAAVVPKLVVEGFLFLVRVFKGVFLAEAEKEAAETSFAQPIEVLMEFFCFLGESLLTHRDEGSEF